MTRSLRGRVLGAMLLLAALTSIVTGLLVRTYVINTDVENERTRAAEILVVQRVATDHILDVGVRSATWEGLQEAVENAAAETRARVVVLDRSADVVLADSDPSGAALTEADVDAVLNPAFGLVAMISDENIRNDALEGCGDQCFDQVGEFSPPASLVVLYRARSEGARFYPSYIIVSGVVVLLASLLLAARVAGRIAKPVLSLSEAISRLNDGDLSQRFGGSATLEVDHLATAFDRLAESLERSEQARQNMVADVAHELRNPIGVIIGNIEAAQDDVLDLDLALLERMHGEATHLSRLVADLHELAAVDAAGLSMQIQSTDLALVVTETLRLHESAALSKRITLAAAGTEPTMIDVDPTRIRQVLTNLVANAITYTPEEGTVTIDIRRHPDHVVLEVADTGAGLTEDEQQRVFDRFWRADQSRTRSTGGAGLGLAISHDIVAAHGGTLSVASRPGLGSRFSVRLPLTRPGVAGPSDQA